MHYCDNNLSSSVFSPKKTNILCHGYCKNSKSLVKLIVYALIEIIYLFVGCNGIIKEELSSDRYPYINDYDDTPLLINRNLNWKLNKHRFTPKWGKILFDMTPGSGNEKDNWYRRSYGFEYRLNVEDMLHTNNDGGDKSFKLAAATQGRSFLDHEGILDGFADDPNNHGALIDTLERKWHPFYGSHMKYKLSGMHKFGVEIQPNPDSNGLIVFKMSEINRNNTEYVKKWRSDINFISGNLIYEMIPHYIPINRGVLIVSFVFSVQELIVTIANDKLGELIDLKWHIPNGIFRQYSLMPKGTVVDYNFRQLDQVPINDKPYPLYGPQLPTGGRTRLGRRTNQ